MSSLVLDRTPSQVLSWWQVDVQSFEPVCQWVAASSSGFYWTCAQSFTPSLHSFVTACEKLPPPTRITPWVLLGQTLTPRTWRASPNAIMSGLLISRSGSEPPNACRTVWGVVDSLASSTPLVEAWLPSLLVRRWTLLFLSHEAEIGRTQCVPILFQVLAACIGHTDFFFLFIISGECRFLPDSHNEMTVRLMFQWFGGLFSFFCLRNFSGKLEETMLLAISHVLF